MKVPDESAPRILIVDDEAVWRSMVRDLLRSKQYHTLEAAGGREALRLFASERPDTVLLDLSLPDVDGIEILKEFHTLDPAVPVIMISGYGDIPAAVEALQAGARDFLTKPLDSRLLLHTINRVIAEEKNNTMLRDLAAKQRLGEKQYRNLIETSHDLIWSIDMEGRISFINSAACIAYGYDADELIGRPFTDVVAPDEVAQSLAAFRNTVETGAGVSGLENTVFRKDGAPIVVSTNSAVLRNDRGDIIGIMGSSREITLQKQREEQLRQYREELERLIQERTIDLHKSSALLRLAVSGADLGVWNRNIRTGELSWSEKLDSLYGYAPGASPGTYAGFIDRVHPDDRARIEAIRDEAIAAHRPFDFDFRIQLPSGALRWVKCLGEARYDRDGEPVNVIGINIEITRQKQMEKELRASEERYRSFFENSLDCILLATPDGRVFDANPAACQVLLMTKEEICAGGREKLLDTTDPQTKRGIEVRAQTGKFIGEITLIRGDGTKFPADAYSSIYRDQSGNERTNVIFRDISERKQAEELLRRYSRRLLALEEDMRKKLAAELHDEIGRDLTALGINLTIIRDTLADESKERIGVRVEDSARLIEGISRIVRGIIAGLRPPVIDDYGLEAALRWHAGLFTKRTGIAVSIEVESPVPCLAVETELALFRIYQEALANASRHARAQCIQIALAGSDGGVLFTVTDSGTGFDPSSLAPTAGSGLGLKIMQERAESIGGRFSLETGPDRGTRISVEVPRREP